MAYDFSTLDSNDFELLSMDILNATFNLDLQSFKGGKDKGIDLRYSSPDNTNAIVVQAKHWLKSGYNRLYRELEKNELSKVVALTPSRYILVTSVSLNVSEKDKLLKMFSPYLHSANDILGKEDLNKYLAALPDLEKRWYKLWLTSVPVLQNIVHNGMLGANEFIANKIVKTTQLYVPCPSYDVAFEILKEHKYLLITGQPGVGKTTLAYYLTYNLLANGYQLLHIDTDISQASILLSPDPATKQIIFFDDFLGETYLEVNRPKTTESAFVLFLERIMASENKYLILTTRTTIYNNALGKYEKLERMKVSVARREIILDQYNILDKARILHKHIYFSEISDEYKDEFFVDKNYWKIITHQNYNPRLIEFVTAKKHIPTDLPTGYISFVINTLNNPKEVWKYFYKDQISVEERLLLHIVFAQNYSAKVDDTKEMFAHMLEYETKNFNYRPGISPFQNACKRLLDGTLKKELYAHSSTGRISFINPSLADFLKYFFMNSEEERKKLLKGSCTIEQFEHYSQSFFTFEGSVNGTESEETAWFANILMNKVDELITYQELKREKNRNRYIRLRISAMLRGLYKLDETTNDRIDHFVFEAISNYPSERLNTESRDFYVKSLRYTSFESELFDYIILNWESIINDLFRSCVSEDDFEEVRTLFDEFHQDYSVYIKNIDNEHLLADCLYNLANELTADWIRNDRGSIVSDDDLLNLKKDIINNRQTIFELYELEDAWYDEESFFNEEELYEIIEANRVRRNENKKDELTNTQKFETTADEHLVKEVELLFSGNYDPKFVKKKAKEIDLPF